MPSENPAMSADSLSIPAESLLEHREFVRRLARSLVRDEHAAQDLAQDAWLEALRRPPRSSSGLRAWLASVVRTRARNKARGEARRTSRELAAAREETDRSEHGLHERFAMQHKVVEAVLALREPYKTVVLLHYYEGLSPSAIAARRGAPSGTVRAQLTRAHELLRERLDAEFGGARAAWAAGLLALARRTGLAHTLALLGALGVALGIPAILWVGRSSPKTAPPLAASAARSLEASPPVEPEPASAPASVASARAVVPSETQRVSARPDAPAQARAEIHGRFSLPDGKPANGVSVEVEGSPANDERVAAYGAPKDWSVPPAATGADGKVSMTLDPPRAFQFFVRAKLEGFCTETWRWIEIEPGASKDLGEVTMRRSGSVAGRIVDTKGRPVQQSWTVQAESLDRDPRSGREPVRAWISADRATGEFRLEGLAPGPNKLRINPFVHGIQEARVEIRVGELAHAEIVYDGPDLGSRITVSIVAEPIVAVLDSPPEIVLQGPGAEERKAKLVPGSQNFVFEGIPPGDYTLVIDDPRFRPWTAKHVEPGHSVKADLQGSASLRLSVVDARTGETVPRYTATLRLDRTRMRPNTFTLVPNNTDPPEDGRFDGLLATSQTLIVGAPGYADLVLPLGDLKPDELRAVEASLSNGASISGRVVQGPAKKTLSGVEVYIVPAVPRDGSFRMVAPRKYAPPKSTRTDESGRFEFTMLPAGTFDVVAECRPGIVAEADGVALGASDRKGDIELTLPALGHLRGRVLGPGGASFEGLSVYARPAKESTEQGIRDLPTHRYWTPPQDLWTPIAADGSYVIDALEAGATQVTLEFPMVVRPTMIDGVSHETGAWMELGTLDVRPDADTQRDFDLRSAFPGTARFTATLAGGAAAIGAVVEVQNDNEIRPIAAAAMLDDHGQARIGPLPPGSYKLLLRGVDTEWFYFAPTALEIRPAGESHSSVEVPLASGDLIVVNADSGDPLASSQLQIRLDGNPRSPAVAIHTDAAGRAKVRLPPGRYRLGHGSDVEDGNDPGAIAFDWSDHGAMPAVLRLGKPAEAK
jgi:RNA polymerase sigma-70 factor (ECF subfamily)